MACHARTDLAGARLALDHELAAASAGGADLAAADDPAGGRGRARGADLRRGADHASARGGRDGARGTDHGNAGPARTARPAAPAEPRSYLNRSSASGRISARAPGPSWAVTWRAAPRTWVTGREPSFRRARSAMAAISSATAIQVALSSRPAVSWRPRQSSSGAIPAHPIVTSHCPLRQARPNESVISTPGAMPLSSLIRLRNARAEASGSCGCRTTTYAP